MKANGAVHVIFNVTRGKLVVSIGHSGKIFMLLSQEKISVTTCDVNYPNCFLSGKKEI